MRAQLVELARLHPRRLGVIEHRDGLALVEGITVVRTGAAEALAFVVVRDLEAAALAARQAAAEADALANARELALRQALALVEASR